MSDLIYRTQAMQCLSGISPGLSAEEYAKIVDDRLKALPSVTLYGYNLDVMMMIYDVMMAKRISPLGAIDLLSNAQLLANEIYADIERTQRKALEEMFNNSIRDEWGSADGRTD